MTLLSKIRMVLWPTIPAPLASENSVRFPLGATRTRLRAEAASALMLSRRGRNFGGVSGGGLRRRFTSMSTASARWMRDDLEAVLAPYLAPSARRRGSPMKHRHS
jgi:hypothetical protein